MKALEIERGFSNRPLKLGLTWGKADGIMLCRNLAMFSRAHRLLDGLRNYRLDVFLLPVDLRLSSSWLSSYRRKSAFM